MPHSRKNPPQLQTQDRWRHISFRIQDANHKTRWALSATVGKSKRPTEGTARTHLRKPVNCGCGCMSRGLQSSTCVLCAILHSCTCMQMGMLQQKGLSCCTLSHVAPAHRTGRPAHPKNTRVWRPARCSLCTCSLACIGSTSVVAASRRQPAVTRCVGLPEPASHLCRQMHTTFCTTPTWAPSTQAFPLQCHKNPAFF